MTTTWLPPVGNFRRDRSGTPTWTTRLTGAGRRPLVVVVIGVLLLAVVPRLILVAFGLPDMNQPDEPTNIVAGQVMVRTGTLVPYRYNYPSLLYDVIAIVLRAVKSLGVHVAQPLVQQVGIGIARTPDPHVVLALRLCTVVASLGTAAVVTVVLARRTRSATAAAVGGGLLAVSPLAVEAGIYIAPDAWTGLFCAVALGGALLVLRRGTATAYLLCGAGVGLAFGAKYNAALVGVALVLAHLLRHRGRAVFPRPMLLLLVGVLAAAVATVVATPGWLLQPHAVWDGLSFERTHYALGQAGHDGSAWSTYGSALLTREPLLLVLAVVGLAAAATETVPRGDDRARELRRRLPRAHRLAEGQLRPEPAARPTRSRPVGRLRGGGHRRARSRVRRVATVALVLGATAMLGLSAVQLARLRPSLEKPARVEAQHWIESHLPPRAPLVVEGYGPWLDPSVWTGVLAPFAAVDGPIPDDAAVVLTQEVDDRYLQDPGRYARKVSAYRVIRQKRCLAAHFGDHGRGIDILVPCP